MSKKQELEQMRYDMYKKMTCVKGVFKDLPLEQKLEYVQSAFNDVRDYCCKAWNIPNYMVSFGFLIGQRSRAIAVQKHGAILYNLKTVMAADENTAAFDIYRTLFHEMAHIKQYNKATVGNVLANLFPVKSLDDGTQTYAQWLASQTETEADFVADSMMIKIGKEAILKSRDKVAPSKFVEDRTFVMRSKFGEHMAGGFRYIKEGLMNLRGENLHSKLGVSIKGGPRIFNLRQVQQVLQTQPIGENYEFEEDFGEALRDFAHNHDDKAHQFDKFFDTNRKFNEKQSQQVLDNSPFIQELEQIVQQSSRNEGAEQVGLEEVFKQRLIAVYPNLGKGCTVEPFCYEDDFVQSTFSQNQIAPTCVLTNAEMANPYQPSLIMSNLNVSQGEVLGEQGQTE